MVPGDMYKWSGGIFAKKTKFHDAGGPGTVVSPYAKQAGIKPWLSRLQTSRRFVSTSSGYPDTGPGYGYSWSLFPAASV